MTRRGFRSSVRSRLTARRFLLRRSNSIFEGIVAKRVDATYSAGRQITWLKIKNRNYSRQEALGFRHKAG